MYSSLVIAYSFVKKGIEDCNPVTQMKLQKLVYFAQGFNLALDRGALIKERFQAWEYGPVVPEIYAQYKIYGSNPIVDTSLLFLFSYSAKKEIESTTLNFMAEDTISVTWDALKDLDAITLSTWAHKEDLPKTCFEICN